MLVGRVRSPLTRWDVKSFASLPWLDVGFERRPLSEVMIRVKEPSDDPEVPLGSLHFDGSITPRSAASLKGDTYIARERQLVFSKIDAAHGAVAILRPGHAYRFSNEYPIYDFSRADVVDALYVGLVCRTAVFLSRVRAATAGHTGRKRVYPEEFEAISVPMPPRDEQIKLRSEYEHGIRAAQELEVDAEGLVSEALDHALEELGLSAVPRLDPLRTGVFAVASPTEQGRWAVRWNRFANAGALDVPASTKFPMAFLGDPSVADIAYGISKSPANRPDRYPTPYLRVANVQDGFLDLREIKEIEVRPDELARYRLEERDILLCEGNSLDLVGRPAIWRDEIPGCVHQNHVLRVRVNRADLDPEFLLLYMMTRAGRNHFLGRAKQTTNLANINSTDVCQLAVPLVPPDVQANLLALVQGAWAERNHKRREASLLREEAWTEFQVAVGGRAAPTR